MQLKSVVPDGLFAAAELGAGALCPRSGSAAAPLHPGVSSSSHPTSNVHPSPVLQFSSTCSGPACHTTGFLVALQQSQPSSSKPKGSQCPPAFFFFFPPIRKFSDFSSGCALCALAPPWVPGLARGASAPGASGEEPLLVLKTGPKKCVTLKSYRKNQEYR